MANDKEVLYTADPQELELNEEELNTIAGGQIVIWGDPHLNEQGSSNWSFGSSSNNTTIQICGGQPVLWKK